MKLPAPVLCSVVLFGVGLLNAQSVWVANSMQRVGQWDAVGTGSNITLYAAKGESESFQVIVRAPSNGLSQINVTASGLTGPGGATISNQNFTLYREHYVYVSRPSPDFGVGNRPLGPGWYPDALIPFKDPNTGLDLSGATYDAVPYNLAGSQNQPFWIDINVPRGAVAGSYTGTITVSSSQGSSTVGLALTVWNFTLPVASRLKSSFGFHGDLGNRANNQVLLQHRIQPFTIVPSDLSTLTSQGAQIVGLPYFNQSSGCTINPAPSVASISAAMRLYPGIATYVYPADEVNRCPNLQQTLQAWAQSAHAAGTKTLVTVVPDPSLLNDGTGSGRSDVDIWTLLPKQYCANVDVLPCAITPAIPTVLAKGDEIWSYTEQEQDSYSPKWMIDFAPINYRIFPGFINQQFGFTGTIYSDVARWTSDPWNDPQTWVSSGYDFPGNSMLVYPGQQVGLSFIVPSMRLKYIRDGVDDFDYMAMLKEKGQASFVQAVMSGVAPDWHNWTKDPFVLEAARIQLGQKLDQLNGGGGVTLGAPTNPWPSDGGASPATALTLQWSSVSGATTYQVYFGPNSTNLSLYATVNAPSVNSAIYDLASSTTYYWKVVAVAGATSASGPVWSFTTPGGSLQPPSNPWPTVGSTGNTTNLTLQWSSVPGATQYQVYFGPSSSSLSLYATVTSGNQYVNQAVYSLSRGTTYYWKIVAINGGTSVSGPVWWFTTQ